MLKLLQHGQLFPASLLLHTLPASAPPRCRQPRTLLLVPPLLPVLHLALAAAAGGEVERGGVRRRQQMAAAQPPSNTTIPTSHRLPAVVRGAAGGAGLQVHRATAAAGAQTA